MFLGAPMAAYSAVVSEMVGRGHGKRCSRTGLARVCGEVQLGGDVGTLADGCDAEEEG